MMFCYEYHLDRLNIFEMGIVRVHSSICLALKISFSYEMKFCFWNLPSINDNSTCKFVMMLLYYFKRLMKQQDLMLLVLHFSSRFSQLQLTRIFFILQRFALRNIIDTKLERDKCEETLFFYNPRKVTKCNSKQAK